MHCKAYSGADLFSDHKREQFKMNREEIHIYRISGITNILTTFKYSFSSPYFLISPCKRANIFLSIKIYFHLKNLNIA